MTDAVAVELRPVAECTAPASSVGTGEGTLRIGIDLVVVEEVDHALAVFGDRYLRRIFTPDEVAHCFAPGRDACESLAARFAAKEAMAKVLEVQDEGIDLSTIEVRAKPSGACAIELLGPAADLARRIDLRQHAVSLTHDRGLAAAAVVALVGGDQPCDTSDGAPSLAEVANDGLFALMVEGLSRVRGERPSPRPRRPNHVQSTRGELRRPTTRP